MAWSVRLKRSVVDDLASLGRKTGRKVLALATDALRKDPLVETRNMKTLRPNPVAERELRLLGKYRVLFNIDHDAEEVTVVLVGEKRGNALIVQGKEFTAHHEDRPTE